LLKSNQEITPPSNSHHPRDTTGADPKRFFVPPYVGHRGWVGMRLDATVEWREVAEIVKRSYRMTAPKKMVATIDGGRRDKKYHPTR
jgi:hypothetical protein